MKAKNTLHTNCSDINNMVTKYLTKKLKEARINLERAANKPNADVEADALRNKITVLNYLFALHLGGVPTSES